MSDSSKSGLRLLIAGIALVGAVAIPVTISLLSDSDSLPIPDPTSSQTATSPPNPITTLGDAYVDVRLNLALELPKDWEHGEFEGHLDVRPPGTPSPAQGGTPAWVEIAWFGDVPSTTNAVIGGLPARKVSTSEAGMSQTTWTVVWPVSEIHRGDEAILSIWTRFDTETGAQHEAALNSIVESIQVLGQGQLGAESISTRFGSVSAELVVDATAIRAIDFLDRRVLFDDPKSVLSDSAAESYSQHKFREIPWLELQWLSYQIIQREDLASGARFTVELEYFENGANRSAQEIFDVSESGNKVVTALILADTPAPDRG